MKNIVLLSVFLCLLAACAPQRDDDYSVSGVLPTVDFSIQLVEGDTNSFVYTDLTQGSFQRHWEFPGGTPSTSSEASDTVFFAKKGDYDVTLYASAEDGSGSGSLTKGINVIADAPLKCGGNMALLTGDCEDDGKCWKFSQVQGAIKIGPTYQDVFSWFASPAEGLVPEQYDDRYCFTFEGQVYHNRNNGASIDPFQGYIAVAIAHPQSTFQYLEGTGVDGVDQIIIENDQFMGVMDSDNIFDVITLTETDLVVRAALDDADGNPQDEGVFELTFVAD